VIRRTVALVSLFVIIMGSITVPSAALAGGPPGGAVPGLLPDGPVVLPNGRVLPVKPEWVQEGEVVVCPWHGWQWDPQTGEAAHGVAKIAVALALFVPLIALGLPIGDTAFAIVRRRRAGRLVYCSLNREGLNAFHRELSTRIAPRPKVRAL